MNILHSGSKKVEQEQHAQANNSIPATAHEMNGAGSGEEETTEIPQQPKNKAHSFCPLLAKEHGEGTAVIFQGLGYKVAKSKKVHKGRKWHYDTLKALEKRWPYLTDSGIHAILQCQAEKNNVFKDSFNKLSFDRTTWYSMTEQLWKRALDEDGKIWFDVPAAVQCRSIIAGTIYQNIRFHLLSYLADNPKLKDAPYYKVNKSALARVLPWSLSTIKREINELLKHKFITLNPEEPKEYTICNKADLVVPDAMKKKALKSGSFMDKNGSSVEMGSGSSVELTGSSLDKSGSFMDKNGSEMDNNTHYKPFEKPFENTHSPYASRGVSSVSSNAADAADALTHSDITKDTGSSTVPVKEECEKAFVGFNSIQDIRNSKDKIKAAFSDSELVDISMEAVGNSHWFATKKIDASLLQRALTASGEAEIIAVIAPQLRSVAFSEGKECGWGDEACEVSFLGSLEITTEALRLRRSESKVVQPVLKDVSKHVSLVYEAIPELNDLTDLPAQAKADLFINEIRHSNKAGWPTYSNGDVKFTVSPSKAVGGAARAFFEANPELSVEDVWKVLADCVEVFKLNIKSGTYDPLFYARRGIKPEFLFKYWDETKAALDSADKLAS